MASKKDGYKIMNSEGYRRLGFCVILTDLIVSIDMCGRNKKKYEIFHKGKSCPTRY